MSEPASLVRGSFRRLAGKEARLALTELWGRVQSCQQLTAIQRAGMVAKRAVTSLSRTPLASLLTMFSVAAGLTFTTLFILIATNTRGVVTEQGTGALFTIFLPETTSPEQLSTFRAKAQQEPWISSVVALKSEEAKKEYLRSLGKPEDESSAFSATLTLPPSLSIQAAAGEEWIENPEKALSDRLERLKILFPDGDVHHNGEHRALLSGFYQSTARVIALLGLVLVFVSLCIVYSTITLTLFSQREEIGVLRLLGAPRSSVRAPYVVEGLCIGLLGAAVALIVTGIIYRLTLLSVSSIPIARTALSQTEFLSWGWQGVVLLLGGLIGAVGSSWAVRVFQREPGLV